jgi:Uncharacterised nucleotidyltransferase
MPFTAEEKLLLSGLLPTAASHARLSSLASEISDWPALVQRAETLMLSPLLRAQLAQTELLETLPATAQQRLAMGQQVWAARSLAYAHEARRLLNAFAEAGIAALPLKGAALLLMEVYPLAGLRPALDLDLLIEPHQIAQAELVAESCGYIVESGRTQARPSQRLPNELNHTAPRRGAHGLLLELHTRAFYFVQGQRAFGWDEMRERAQVRHGILLPAAEDLALHLLHHTMVDWQSTQAILRTLADLHFLLAAEPAARERLHERAQMFGLHHTVTLVGNALHQLATASLDELGALPAETSLLLETALLPDARAVADAARLFEYFDFSRQPRERLRALAALLFTNRAHLEQLYGTQDNPAVSYLRRPADLLRKFNWASVSPAMLQRLRRLRHLTESSGN